MYRALARMVESGLIEAAARRPASDTGDERRNYYRITNAGMRVARVEAQRLQPLTRAARLGGLLPKVVKMTRNRMLNISERWFWLLQHFYPPDFRDEMGNAVVEAYTDRTRDALTNRGKIHIIALWLRAFVDSLRNGAAEWVRPAASWRRAGNWGRDVELVRRRLVRSPPFAATTIGTLTIGLGMFAVVFTAVQKVLIDPRPYKNPRDLYYVWRDYGPIVDLKRAALAGTDIAELQKTNPVSRTRWACSRSWAASSRSWTARRRVAFRSAHAADRRSWLAACDQGDVLCASAVASS